MPCTCVCWLSWARCDLRPSWVGCLTFRVGALRPAPELGRVPRVQGGHFATCTRVGSGALRLLPVLCDLYPSWVRCLASASGPLRLAPELGQVPSAWTYSIATCARVGSSALRLD